MAIVFLRALLSNYQKKRKKSNPGLRGTVTEDKGQGDRTHFNPTFSVRKVISVTHRRRLVIDSALITENGA